MRLPIWASLFTLIGVAILCTLGTWQVQRLQWKNNVIEQLDTAYQTGTDKPLIFLGEYAYGEIKGKLLTDKALLLGPRTYEGNVGYHLLIPVMMDNQSVIVNFGWTDLMIDDLELSADQTDITLSGLARKPSWNRFTSPNVPDQDLWFRADIEEIADAKTISNALPYLLYADRASLDLGTTVHEERWYPRNNHLQYALFWYGMAGVLIVIFSLRFLRTNNR